MERIELENISFENFDRISVQIASHVYRNLAGFSMKRSNTVSEQQMLHTTSFHKNGEYILLEFHYDIQSQTLIIDMQLAYVGTPSNHSDFIGLVRNKVLPAMNKYRPVVAA